jgi:thiamine biosynthesis lipoprotein
MCLRWRFPVAVLSFAASVLLAAWIWNGQAGSEGAQTGGENISKFSAEFFDIFDTVVTFTAFAGDEGEFRRYAEIVRDEMGRLHRLFDIYHEYEGLVNVKTVNDNAGGAPLRVDPSFADLLERAKEAYGDTDGAVNVALGPVLKLWHDARERVRAGGEPVSLPSETELRGAAVRVSVEDILIDRENSAVSLRHSGMRLDLGAVAKGYAVQKTVERLREAGLKSGIINAGGNVAIVGKPLDGRDAWNIGVHAPTEEDRSKILDVLRLADGAAVTSGNDQRYFMAEGRRYHHIIDPKTLFPAEGLKSVTVLHPDSATADILSTAAFILPLDKARELLRRHGAEALWVAEDGMKLATRGYLPLSKTMASADKPRVRPGAGETKAPRDRRRREQRR